jgi:cysteine desulfurase/selenocysteine lyase
VIGLSAALDFAKLLNWNEVSKHQCELGEKLREGVKQLQGFHVVGDAKQKSGIVSFLHNHIHPHDIASFLASKNIAVRAGHHCTQPLLDSLGIAATVRASFSIYNTHEDVEKILDAQKDLNKFWS